MNGNWLVVNISHLTTLLVEVRLSERVHTDLYVRGNVVRGAGKKKVVTAVTRAWTLNERQWNRTNRCGRTTPRRRRLKLKTAAVCTTMANAEHVVLVLNVHNVCDIAQESEIREFRVKLSAKEKLFEAYERKLQAGGT
jgi:hypothetical protein